MGEIGTVLFVMVATMVTSMFGYTTGPLTNTTSYPEINEFNCSDTTTPSYRDHTVCKCDPDCARYSDCCRSSPYFVAEEQRLGYSPFKCLKFPPFYNTYAITTCPSYWQDVNIRRRCEQPKINFTDILDAPVTSTGTNITYRNWYCALCNQDLKAETTFIWIPKLDCYGNNGEVDLFDSPETLADTLSYNELTSKWTVKANIQTDATPFPTATKQSMNWDHYNSNPINWNNNYTLEEFECDLYYRAPEVASRMLRYCVINVISHCAENWIGSEVEMACEAYTARLCSKQTYYRNYNCLICNNFTDVEPCQFGGGPVGPSLSFSVLLDFKRLKRNACPSSQVYDPLARICRRVYI